MKWDEFYDRFFDWAESTQVSRISTLENFGDADEVYDVAIEFQDEKVATRFLKKALAAGVHFSTEQVTELIGNVTDDIMLPLIKSAYGKFTDEELEILSGYIDAEDLIKLVRAGNTSPKVQQSITAGKYCGYCGTYVQSNYCPNCGRLMRNDLHIQEKTKKKPAAFGEEWFRNMVSWLIILFFFFIALIMLFTVSS